MTKHRRRRIAPLAGESYTIGLSIPVAVFDALDKLARDRYLPMSAVVRTILIDELREQGLLTEASGGDDAAAKEE